LYNIRRKPVRFVLLAAAILALQPLSAQSTAGLNPGVLASLDADIASGKYGNIDSVLILHHGEVAFDHTYAHDYRTIYADADKKFQTWSHQDPGGPYDYFNPWWHPYLRNTGTLHTEQSVTKTVLSMVIGVATTRGEFPPLDTPVLKFFDESKVANVDQRKRHLTLRNLITMTVGMQWNDDLPYNDPNNMATKMEESCDWVQTFIDQPMQEEPGTKFYYNDGAPQALGYIFRKATGQDIEEYASKYLFAPLGIANWYWKRTPKGTPDTEGGLYLDRHDLAKLMQLFQHDGMWEGHRIVGSDWVKASIAPQVTVSEKFGVKYGYLWWLYPYGKENAELSFGGSGYGGQIPVVLPAEDIVIVVNAWNIDNHKGLRAGEIISRVLAAVPRSQP
jgi:CubicO group peptidase (beta-lactamase class C family)